MGWGDQGPMRLLLLATTSMLGGVADSVMSPYFCPLARSRGFGASTCGHVISARFCTQIVFILLFGRLMRRVGAWRIYLSAVAICSVFNTMFSLVDLVTSPAAFLVTSVVMVVLSTVGDAGIFCSIYVLAGQEELPCRRGEGSSSGPALMETMYAVGVMVGPPLGGLLYLAMGWRGLAISIGLAMATAGLATAAVGRRKDGDSGEPQAHAEDTKEKYLATVEKQKDPQSEVKKTMTESKHSNTEETLETTVGVDLSTPTSPTVEESKTAEEVGVTHLSAACRPWVAISCLVMVASGVTATWYLATLESHLSLTLGLSPTTVGLVYMCPGLVYALLTPLTGALLDHGIPHLPLILPAILANIAAYTLLGPSPFLPWPPSLATTVIGLLLHGLGLSLTLMPCLSLMTQEAGAKGEAAAGIVTSLWECCELVGGYLGSTLGGVAGEAWGFPMATAPVLLMEAIVISLIIAVLVFQRNTT